MARPRPQAAASAAVYGGVGFGAQLKALRRGVDMLVACPGRLADLIERREVDLDEVEIVVVDEADRMADMGFLPAVSGAARPHAADRQTLLFSATLDGAVDQLVRRYQRDPSRHVLPTRPTSRARRTSSGRSTATSASTVTAEIVDRRRPDDRVLPHQARRRPRWPRSSTQRGVRSAAIHGDRSQGQRERALAAFADGKVDALVATDVAARGIHVDDGRVRRALRPAGRLQGLHAPLRPHRACRCRGHRRVAGRRPTRRGSRRASSASSVSVRGLDRARRPTPRASASSSDGTRAAVARRRPRRPRRRPTDARAAPSSGSTRARASASSSAAAASATCSCTSRTIEGDGYRRLEEGQVVEFELAPGNKGEQARRVRVLAAA